MFFDSPWLPSFAIAYYFFTLHQNDNNQEIQKRGKWEMRNGVLTFCPRPWSTGPEIKADDIVSQTNSMRRIIYPNN